MKKILGILVLSLFMSACATTQAINLLQSGQETDLFSAVSKVTVADLDAAMADAQQNNDVIAMNCYPVLKKYVLMGSQGTTKIVGAFSAYQKARDIKKGIGAGVPDDLKLGCAAMLQETRDFVLKMAAIAGASSVVGPAAPALIP